MLQVIFLEMSKAVLFALFASFIAYAAADTATVSYFTDKACTKPATNTTCGAITCNMLITGFESAGMAKGATCSQKACVFSFAKVKTGTKSCASVKSTYDKLGCQGLSAGGGTPTSWQKTSLTCSGASQLTLGLFSFFVVALNLFK